MINHSLHFDHIRNHTQYPEDIRDKLVAGHVHQAATQAVVREEQKDLFQDAVNISQLIVLKSRKFDIFRPQLQSD